MHLHRDRTPDRSTPDRRIQVWLRSLHPWWVLLVLAMASGPAWSQATCTWNVNGAGAWDEPDNWNGCSSGNGSPTGTPGPADHAVIGNIAPNAAVDVGSVPRNVNRLTLSAGRIHGESSLSVASNLVWVGGEIDGASGFTNALTLGPGSTAELSGLEHVLRRRDLVNAGEITWSGGDIGLFDGAEIDNQGVIIIDADGGIRGLVPLLLYSDSSPGTRLHNSASAGVRIDKQGAGQAEFALDFDNGNDVNVISGLLRISGGGGDFGSYDVSGMLEFAPFGFVTRTLTGAPAVTGTGILRKVGFGTLVVTGDYTLGGSTEVLGGVLSFDTPADPLLLPAVRVEDPGTLTGADHLRISSSLLWAGGTISGDSPGLLLELQSGVSANLFLNSVAATANLINRNLVNQGTLSINGSANVNMYLGLDAANIDNQALLVLQNNSGHNLLVDCVNTDCGTFGNAPGATLRFDDTQGGIVLIGNQFTAFDNDGLVELIQGCAAIGAPGVDTGTYRYAGTCTLGLFPRADFARTLEPSVVLDQQGNTSLQVGGTLNINGTSRDFGHLILDPLGVLQGPADFVFTQSFIWRGEIAATQSERTVTIAAGAFATTSDTPQDTPVLARRTLNVDGQLTISDVRLALFGGTTIRNTGQLRLTGTAAAAGAIGCSDIPPDCGTVHNVAGGIVEVVAAPGGPVAEIETDVVFNNEGSLQVATGVVRIEAGFTAASGSDVDIAAGAGLRRTSGTLVLAAGALRGRGVVNANLAVDAVTIQPASTGSMGTLGVLGNFTASSNTVYEMEVGGTTPEEFPRIGVVPPRGGGPTYDRLSVSGSAALAGTLDVIQVGGFVPAGSDFFDLLTYANASGSILPGANPFSGLGFVLLTQSTRVRLAQPTGGVVCVWNPAGLGPDNWTNPNKWTGCSAGTGPGPGPAGTPGAPDTAVVGSGVVNLDVDVGVDRLEFTGGNIQGPSNLSVINQLVWTGGRFIGTSAQTVTVAFGSSAEISGGQHSIDGRAVHIDGFATWTTGLIELANGGALQIGPSGTLLSNPSLALESVFASGTGTGELRNFGAIIKNGANSSGINANVQYAGAGSITVLGGQFIFAASSLVPLDGSYTVDLGAVLHFVANNRSFGSVANLGGNGTLVFGDSGPGFSVNSISGCFAPASNLVVRYAQVDIDCALPTQLDSLLMVEPSGILEGSSSIEVASQLTWGHGTIRGTGPSERVVLLAGGSGSFPSPQAGYFARALVSRRFVNHGSIQWSGENALQIDSAAVFENDGDGLLEFVGGVGSREFISDLLGPPLLINRGTFRVLDGTLVGLSLPFDNTGPVDIVDGEFRHHYGSNDNGNYSLGIDGLLAFDAITYTLDSGSTVAGGGSVDVVNGAALTVTGNFAPGFLLIAQPSSLAFESGTDVQLQNVLLDRGTLSGNDEVQINGAMEWFGGSVLGTGASPGPLQIQPGATLELQFPLHTLGNRVLRIAGQAEWGSGGIVVPQDQGAKIDVVAGGTLLISNIKTGVGFGCAAAPCTAELELAGSLLQTGDGADLQLTSPMLMTGGLLQVSSYFEVPGLQVNAGIVEVQADGAQLHANPLILDGGQLRGGTVVGDVSNNAGSLQPGFSPGELEIFGDYVQGPSGTLEIQVGGLTPVTQSDRLSATGTITLDGTLVVTDNGYTLTDPDTLEFLSAVGGRTGTFASTSIAHPGYTVDYGPFAATLVPGGPVALVVNSVDDLDDGACDLTHCSLREALNQSNVMPDPDTIQFNIPAPQCTGPGGACTITPATSLPIVIHPIDLDGYTQPGASVNSHPVGLGLGVNAVIRIELDGSLAAGDGLALNTPSMSSTRISGLAMYGWNNAIVHLGPVDNLQSVLGNFLGLRADGSVPPGPQAVGVSANGGSVVVGDGSAAGVNVISGNAIGIRISNNVIGGSLSVRGNLIGTEVGGLVARGNQVGIEFLSNQDSPAITIGGNLPDQRNIISGNVGDGLRLQCTASAGNCFGGALVSGNWIGPAVDGSALGNGQDGIHIQQLNGGQLLFGGTVAGTGNEIAYNGGSGIRATNFSGLARALWVRNGIHDNGALGIDLGGDGRTANDAGDPDLGPNGLLNFPTFASYTAPGGTSAVIEVVLTTPDISGNYPARVDFYKAIEDEPGVWLGTTTCAQPFVTCSASFVFPGGVSVAPDDVVLGIVSDGFGKSSEASFYTTAVTVSDDSPDPSLIGTPYTVAVDVSSTDSPFAPLGGVDVDDGAGNNCQVTLAPSGPAVSSGTCQLPSLAPAGGRTVTASYAPGSAQAFAASSDQESHVVAGATVVVNSAADPGNGTCDASECTLREGIAIANALMLPDVNFDATFFSVPRTITLSAGELTPTQNVNINGPGAALLTISANNSGRVFASSGVNWGLSGATITGGAGVVGGAIQQSGGILSLTDVTLSGNTCTGAGTGVLATTFGTLNLTRTTVSGNNCFNVSGVYLQDGAAVISDSTFSGNSGADGEALRVTASSGDASATLSNVTISGNSTTTSNAGIRSEPLSTGRTVTLTLSNVTISGNSTSSAGGFGALWLIPSSGTHIVTLHNTIVSGNTVGGSPRDIDGSLDPASSFNLIGTGGGLSNGVNGNQVGINTPLLAALGNYGGSTQTRALLPGSPALDAGSNALAPALDQRGIARPQQGTVDIGAYESRGFGLVLVSGSPQTTAINSVFPQPLVVGLTANAAGEPVDGGAVTYSAPGAGPSATFTNPAIVAGGQASLLATANGTAGSYVVTASAAGAAGSPSFALTNGCPPTVVTSGNDSGAGTLRQVIADACAGSVVTFAGGVGTINLSTAELVVAKDLTIDGGAGVTVTRQTGSPSFRIFRIDAGNTVVLDSLTISNGNVAGDGAGILNFGNLSVLDSVLSGNASTAGNGGGGIANYGTLSVDNSTIAQNSAVFAGGGVVQIDGGNATLTRCTLSGNSAPQGAGAMLQSVTLNSSMTISNCTISGNSGTLTGSGLANFASGSGTSSTLTVTNSTIANNTGPVGAVVTGVNAGAATVTLRNNIYAGNSADNVRLDAPAVITSLGNNLSDDATGGGGPGDLINTDPLLAPLAIYGGSTATHALLPGSPAINAGSNAGAPATDQRGVARPQQATVDIGAFESQGFVLSVVSGTPQTAPVNSAFALPLLVGVVANAGGEPVNGGQVSYSAPGAGASATFVSPATIAGGQASVLATANGTTGSYVVTASAAGATGTPSFALTNGTLPTTTTITGILPVSTVVGQPYAVSVSVLEGSSPVTVGTVEVRQLSDGAMCTINLASASSCQLVANNALTTAVRANYLGSGVFAPSQSGVSTHDVTRASTTVTIVEDAPDPSAVLQPVTVRMTLSVVAPGAGTPTGEILVTDGIASCSATLPNLSCELIPKALGAATLEARYLGDADFNPSTDTEPHTITAEGADLAIIKRNGLRLLPGGQPSTYVLLVSNAGPQSVVNARVTDILPPQFSGASWTCTAANGSTCPPNGAGNVDTLVSIGAGSSITIELTATAQANPEQVVTNTATVAPPANAPDPVTANNSSTDIDPIGFFGDGFETENE